MLCRFTAFVAVDSRVVNEGGETRRVTQPVELPSGWEPAVGGVAPGDDAAGLGARRRRRRRRPPWPAGIRAGRALRAEGLRSAPAGTGGADRPASVLGLCPSDDAAGQASLGSAVASLDQVREIAATEVQRLREAARRPAYERRDLLDDLASRLTVLLSGAPATSSPRCATWSRC